MSKRPIEEQVECEILSDRLLEELVECTPIHDPYYTILNEVFMTIGEIDCETIQSQLYLDMSQ